MHVHPAMTLRRFARRSAARLAPAVALGLWLLTACSSTPSTPAAPGPVTPPTRFSIKLSTSQVSFAAGATVHLTATVTRDAGFTGAVTLSLNGAPTGLTATFTPVSGTPDASDIALSAVSTLDPLTYDLSIDGAAGIETESAKFAATVGDATSFDVQGSVVDLFHEPVAGAQVTIAGTRTTAAADGSFTVPGVTRPYNVIVTLPGKNEVHDFVGLDRTNPVLPLLDQVVTPPDSASVSGTITNAAANTSSQLAEVAFASPEAHGTGVLWGGDGPSFGPFNVTWSGPSSTQGNLYALKWSVGPTGLPDQYLGFAKAALSLSNQQSATGADLQFGAVATSYLSGTVSPPPGYTISAKDLWMTPGPMTGMLLGIVADNDATFTFATPQVGLPLGVEAEAVLGTASTILYRANLDASQVVDLTLPAPPVLGAPGTSTFDHTTTFGWTPVPGTISVLWLASPGGPSVFVYTAASNATLPAPPALNLPATTHYSWTVVGWGMYADMDAFTDPAGAPGSFGLGQDALLATAAPLGVITSSTP